MGVAGSQWEWHVHSGSGRFTVGVASLQWEWHLYSGSGISTVGVACSQWEQHVHSRIQIVYKCYNKWRESGIIELQIDRTLKSYLIFVFDLYW